MYRRFCPSAQWSRGSRACLCAFGRALPMDTHFLFLISYTVPSLHLDCSLWPCLNHSTNQKWCKLYIVETKNSQQGRQVSREWWMDNASEQEHSHCQVANVPGLTYFLLAHFQAFIVMSLPGQTISHSYSHLLIHTCHTTLLWCCNTRGLLIMTSFTSVIAGCPFTTVYTLNLH